MFLSSLCSLDEQGLGIICYSVNDDVLVRVLMLLLLSDVITACYCCCFWCVTVTTVAETVVFNIAGATLATICSSAYCLD